MKLNDKRLQYYKGYSGNRVLFLPNLTCAGNDNFGTFIVNGEKIEIKDEVEFVKILSEFKANSLQIQGENSKEPVKTLIHFVDLNYFLKVKYSVFKKFFTMGSVSGTSEHHVFKIETNYFSLIELNDCVRIEKENPSIEDYWNAISERLK